MPCDPAVVPRRTWVLTWMLRNEWVWCGGRLGQLLRAVAPRRAHPRWILATKRGALGKKYRTVRSAQIAPSRSIGFCGALFFCWARARARGRDFVARKCRRSRLRRARTRWTVRNPPRPPGKARPYSPSFPCGSPLRHLTLAADGPRQRGAVDSCRPDGERRQPRGAGHRGEGATARVCAVAGRRICSRPECSGGAPVKDVKYLVCARVCLPQGVSLRCVQLVASTEASEHVASPAHAHEDISTHTRG